MRFAPLVLLFAPLVFGQSLRTSDPVFLGNASSLNKGLKAYYKLNEATGTRYDYSYLGSNLSPTNAPGNSVGVVGNCAAFNAPVFQYLQCPDNTNLRAGTNSFFVSFWVKLNTKNQDRMMVTKYGATGSSKADYAVLYLQSADRIGFYVTTNGSTGFSVNSDALGSPATNVWYLINAWWDKSNTSINITVNNGTTNTTTGVNGIGNTTAQFMIGQRDTLPANSYMDGWIDEVGLWSRIPSLAERTILNTGVTKPQFHAQIPCNVNLAFEGDSITAAYSGDTNKYPFPAAQAVSPALGYYNFAQSGSKISDLIARAAFVDTYYDQSKTNILSVDVGANDLAASADVSGFVANLKSYCQARQATGWKVIACTIISNCNASVNSRRATANSSIRSDPSFYNALCDFSADSIMGLDATCANGTYFSDGIHPTSAGYLLMDPSSAAALNALMPALSLGCQ